MNAAVAPASTDFHVDTDVAAVKDDRVEQMVGKTIDVVAMSVGVVVHVPWAASLFLL